MSKKAVYNNQGLAVYVTSIDFEQLLKEGYVYAEVYIGKIQINPGLVYIAADEEALYAFQEAVRAERLAILKVQEEFKKEHPNYKKMGKRDTEAKYAEERRRTSANGTSQDGSEDR